MYKHKMPERYEGYTTDTQDCTGEMALRQDGGLRTSSAVKALFSTGAPGVSGNVELVKLIDGNKSR